ncbi:MAG TPA: hypothetical protein VES42_18095 [Pilimelia sp.]|nr:hypothetical protein [Pilimelia sp.]
MTEPTSDQPTSDQPSSDQPSSEQPTNDQPSGSQPVGDEPATDRVGRRAAHLLPEERSAGDSADPRVQAEIILAESDIRTADQDAGPDSFVEHRTSDQAADL